MKFYCIIRSQDDITNQYTYTLLQDACKERKIEFISLEANQIDYSKLSLLVDDGSLLYRLAGGRRSALLEVLLYTRTINLARNAESLLSRSFMWGSAIRLEQAGLPIIPTIFNIRSHDNNLESYVEQLGGYPVVIKSPGGSHGAGVMIADSMPSLRSVVDYVAEKDSLIVLRKYLKNARHYRLLVLGDKVIDSIEYRAQRGDFRTNAVDAPKVQKADISDEIERDAVTAVASQGLEFGGVDILIDETEKHYIAEVNYPCNFARNQMTTGFDVSGAIIDYLVLKKQMVQNTNEVKR